MAAANREEKSGKIYLTARSLSGIRDAPPRSIRPQQISPNHAPIQLSFIRCPSAFRQGVPRHHEYPGEPTKLFSDSIRIKLHECCLFRSVVLTPAVRTQVPRLAQRIQCRGVALGYRKAKAPARGLSTLNSMTSGLAVYASPDRLPGLDAKLASSRWSDATGRALHPQGPNRRFQSAYIISSSFARLAWRNRCDRSG